MVGKENIEDVMEEVFNEDIVEEDTREEFTIDDEDRLTFLFEVGIFQRKSPENLIGLFEGRSPRG